MEIYVGNFPYNTTERELENLFASHGDVESVHIVTDHYTRQSKCFGYVEMNREHEAENAVEDLHGLDFNKNELVVKCARPCFDRQGSRW